MLSMSGRLGAKRLRSRCPLLFWVWARRRFRSPIPLRTSSLRLWKPKKQQVRFPHRSKRRQVQSPRNRSLRPLRHWGGMLQSIATLRPTRRLKLMALRITPRLRHQAKMHPVLLRRTRLLRLRLVTIRRATSQALRPISQAIQPRLRRRTQRSKLKLRVASQAITFTFIQRSLVTPLALR